MEDNRERFRGHAVYSLSEIAMSLHRMIEQNYSRPYYVKAEILKLNYYPRSGHCYPELVEKEGGRIKSQMRAIIWKTQFDQINGRFQQIAGERLKENINILFLATLEFSPVHGLALHIQDIEPSYTLGEMLKNKLMVIERLKKEGVFGCNKKLEMALLPQRVAVISVETSKGYSDFMNTLRDNQYGYKFHTELFPTVLQGDKAVAGIADCLLQIERRCKEFDCAVFVRGGGGDVGLSCYDEYDLARRVATFCLPVLTGIGHSTNKSVTDQVAYEDCITPTDVAFSLISKCHDFDVAVQNAAKRIFDRAKTVLEVRKLRLTELEAARSRLVTQVVSRQREAVGGLSQRLVFLARQLLEEGLRQTAAMAESLRLHGRQIVEAQQQRLSEQGKLAKDYGQRLLKSQHDGLANMEGMIRLLHPDNILRRGFSITRLAGKAVTDAGQLPAGTEISTQLFQGKVTSVVK